ncbi:MAG: acyl carrier protein [bacterium]|nr:acyl carrier protein [bacterium]
MATVLERVKRVVEEKIAYGQEITLATDFERDLKADSLDLVELIMEIEQEFKQNGKGLEISDKDAEGITTVQAVVDYLKSRGFED